MTTDDRADLLRDLWRHRATLPPGQAQKRINRCASALFRCWERLDSGNASAATSAHLEAIEALLYCERPVRLTREISVAPLPQHLSVLSLVPPELMERVQRAARVTA